MINGGLSEEQIAEMVVDDDDDEYGFVKMVRSALVEAGVLKEETPLGKLHALAPPKGRRKNPFLFVLQNDLRKSKDFAAALHRFLRRPFGGASACSLPRGISSFNIPASKSAVLTILTNPYSSSS